MKQAYFAGGCFWCTEHDLKALPGVLKAISGYAGDKKGRPSYEDHRGYREAVEVEYDPALITFKKLCQFFLDSIDPTDAGGQFYDRGESYKTAIYVSDDEEKKVAEGLLLELGESEIYDKPIVVEVLPKPYFYDAEEYHQDYADKNPDHYNAYATGSGRKNLQQKVCQIREEKHIKWKD